MTRSTYRAPAWLPGGHLQTLYAALMLRPPCVAYRRERWDTPDGDFIDLDWVDGNANTPLLVLFHGLEGNAQGHYARALMHAVMARSWRGVVVHFRGCGGTPNRLARAYHSGDSAEIDWVLCRLKAVSASAPLYAAGVSLGGNALLKWLGEQGGAAMDIVTAAVAVSAPLDLHAAGSALERGMSRLYTWHFLRSLKPKSLAKLARHPELLKMFDAGAVRSAHTLREFDDVVTAPLHGFKSYADYWTRASSKPLLHHIAVPTLLVNARNDPFLPQTALPHAHEVSPSVNLEFPAQGGHVGFVSGAFPGRFDWLPQRMLAFFDGVSH
ncbi:MAG: hydrolase [Pseudomonadota bacterium]